MPWSILRMSLVIGDSATGSTPRFQGVYAAMKSLITGGAPVVLGGRGQLRRLPAP